MKEAFLHYLFDQRKLGKTFETISGAIIEIIEFGKLNKNAGPDFLEAKIRIDKTVWAGHIEFHLKSSDWLKHKHQNDSAYESVIAHFVYEHDADIYSGNYLLPEVELKSLISPTEIYKYENFVKSKAWIPCETQLKYISNDTWQIQKTKALEQRLDRKSSEVSDLLALNKGDQLKTLLIILGKTFGSKVNTSGFETLCTIIEVRHLAQLNYDAFKIQALFHGLSGLLPKSSDNNYVQSLRAEFEYQIKLFEFVPMPISSWKFSSLRPTGSPTIRIAQMAALLSKPDIINQLVDFKTDKEQLFNIQLDSFWETHYNFQNETKSKSVQLSDDFVRGLIINAFIPFQLVINNDNSSQKIDRAKKLLSRFPAETNGIVKRWKTLGVSASSAFDTQALLEQKNELCNQKKCLFCNLGKQLLNL